MPINPQLLKVYEERNNNDDIPLYAKGVIEVRDYYENLVPKESSIVCGNVEDVLIPVSWGKMLCRIYTPTDKGLRPLVVFFHGGGGVLQSVHTHDEICRHLCRISKAVVISVEYRLAPEYPYPCQLEDCYEATLWAYDNAASLGANKEELAVCGDSAGGTLALTVCMKALEKRWLKIKYQCLIYPAAAHYVHYTMHTPAYRDFIKQFGANASSFFVWMNTLYCGGVDSDWKDPYLCPLFAESLAGLPPAHIIAAEYDVLKSEDAALAHRLEEDNVPVKYSFYHGLDHGFIEKWDKVDAAMDALKEIAEEINNFFQYKDLGESQP